MSPLLKRSMASLLGLLLAVGSLEGALRLHERLWPRESAGVQFSAPDPELGWRNAPGARGLFRARDYTSAVRINALGLRGGPVLPGPPDQTVRILFLGDSATAGFEVEERDTFAARVQAALNACGGGAPAYEAINAGVRGYGTDQALLYYERHGKKLGAALVVHAMVHNDLFENTQAAGLGGYYPKPRFQLEGGRLALDPPSSSALTQALGGPLPRAARYLRQRSRLAGWAAPRLQGAQDGPPEWVREIAPEYLSPRPEEKLEARGALFRALLSRMKESVHAEKAKFLFLTFPAHWELSPEAARRAMGPALPPGARLEPGAFHATYLLLASSLRLSALETLPAFRRGAGPGKRLYVPDGHLSPEGHALMAELIFRRIVEGELLPLPPGGRERCLQRLASARPREAS
ncbi:MAG: hypothetical protein AABZ64_09755 [Nitrospinota bacterium]|mgnify:CR=1 FL=1